MKLRDVLGEEALEAEFPESSVALIHRGVKGFSIQFHKDSPSMFAGMHMVREPSCGSQFTVIVINENPDAGIPEHLPGAEEEVESFAGVVGRACCSWCVPLTTRMVP